MGRAFQNRKESMAKTSDMKAKVYSKYSREIYVCGKNGGVEPESNLALSSLIDRAKRDQVPAHVIDKALQKAAGGGGEDFVPVRFEGYGPGSSMVMVECLTDNNTRTFGDVRFCFTKAKCKIGTEGSVAHMFDHYGVFVLPTDDEDGIMEALMEADVDAQEIEVEDGKTTVFAPFDEYGQARSALLAYMGDSMEFDMDEIQWVPKMTKQLEGEELEMFDKFIAMLEDNDDVQKVYHDVE